MCYFFPRKQAWSSWNLVPQSCVMNASLSFILSSFQSEGNYAFVSTAIRWNKFQLLQACLRGKSSTFKKWHCLRIIALESKRLIHTLWTWCQITWKRIFYPIQQKSMVFNQECRWNNGSKSLHSFWATLYSKVLQVAWKSLKAIWNTKVNKKLPFVSIKWAHTLTHPAFHILLCSIQPDLDRTYFRVQPRHILQALLVTCIYCNKFSL